MLLPKYCMYETKIQPFKYPIQIYFVIVTTQKQYVSIIAIGVIHPHTTYMHSFFHCERRI